MTIVRPFDSIDALSEATAAEIVRLAAESVAARGGFSIALAGGNTPRRTYELLATSHRNELDWQYVTVVFGDERFVGTDDPRSNYRMAREALFSRVPIPPGQVHPVPTDSPTPAAAAEAYDRTLRHVLASDDGTSVDVALLGIGPDGHTASLFPGFPAVQERSRWATAVDAPTAVQPAVPRVTTTLPFLNAARHAIFLIAGADKRPVVEQMLRVAPGASPYPAAMVAPQMAALWMIERALLPADWPNA
ncbi:MAG TPA: 6-phosphogluconolactonase [Gemmatimonadaceae bacterium]|nr:6-phosphogluconolactonase [Gemmatimonadaceae bacterium]